MTEAHEADKVVGLATTVESMDDARQLAAALVGRRLAACVQLEQLESHYRWDGRVCQEPEVRLTVKTAPARLADLHTFLQEHHPYQLPQLLWQTWSASPAYAAWVRTETAPADG